MRICLGWFLAGGLSKTSALFQCVTTIKYDVSAAPTLTANLWD